MHGNGNGTGATKGGAGMESDAHVDTVRIIQRYRRDGREENEADKVCQTGRF